MPDYLTLADVQRFWPSAAPPASVTGTTAGVWTAWTEIVADSGAAATMITGVMFKRPEGSNIGQTYAEMQLGIGSAGVEEIIGTFHVPSTGTSEWRHHMRVRLPVFLDAVPANSRVSMRIRHGRTGAYTGKVQLTYLTKPVSGLVTSTTKPVLCLPFGSAPEIALSTTVQWTWSAWTELSASMPNASIALGGPVSHQRAVNQIDGWCETELGIGAAGGETTIASRLVTGIGDSQGVGYIRLFDDAPVAGGVIPQGARLAWRARGGLDVNEAVHSVHIHYVEGDVL